MCLLKFYYVTYDKNTRKGRIIWFSTELEIVNNKRNIIALKDE